MTKETSTKEIQKEKTSSAIPTPEAKANAPQESKPVIPKPKPLTIAELKQELKILKQAVSDHAGQIIALQETLARKRRPAASNGKIQIRDKQTGKVYPSKNNAYQSLLKAGELKELVDKGVFEPTPEKNTFGWYTLAREWPDRFEEVKPEKALTDGKP